MSNHPKIRMWQFGRLILSLGWDWAGWSVTSRHDVRYRFVFSFLLSQRGTHSLLSLYIGPFSLCVGRVQA